MQRFFQVTGSDVASKDAFWSRYLRVGFVVLAVAAGGTVLFARTSASFKSQTPLTILSLAVFVAALTCLPLAGWVAHKAWRYRFSYLTNLATGVVLTAACAMDGGIDSHLLYLGVLPILNAGLALGVGAVAVCSIAGVGEVGFLLATDPKINAADNVVIFAFVLVVSASLLAVTFASSRTVLECAEAREREQLTLLAETDALTGCINHRVFEERLEAEMDRFNRYRTPLSLMIADIDLFKSFNDKRGHQAGDDALAALGGLLRKAARQSDIVARVGGDEFAIVLPSTPEDQALAAAQRIVQLVDASGIGVSLSIGVASADVLRRTARRIFFDADTALYRAKSLGRGKACGFTRRAESATAEQLRPLVPRSPRQEDFDRLADQARRGHWERMEGRAQMQATLDAAPFGMCFVDRDFRIQLLNSIFARFNTRPVEDQVGRAFEELMPELWAQFEPLYRQVLETGVSVTLPEAIEDSRSDGLRRHYWLTSIFPVKVDDQVDGFGVIVVDVTDRRELEDANARMVRNTVTALAATVEERDPYTSGHEARVAAIAVAIANDLGWDPGEVEQLALASRIHDLGKLRVPAEILSRPGPLNNAETALVREHAQSGYDIMKVAGFPEAICQIVLQHHERLDGSGYPRGLVGDAICRGAKALAVADVVDAMSSPRPYRPALSAHTTMAELLAGRGSRYDKDVVDAYLRLFRDELIGKTPGRDGNGHDQAPTPSSVSTRAQARTRARARSPAQDRHAAGPAGQPPTSLGGDLVGAAGIEPTTCSL